MGTYQRKACWKTEVWKTFWQINKNKRENMEK